MIQLTKSDLVAFIKNAKEAPFKAEALKMLNEMRTHVLGEYPAHLIEEARPNESPEIKQQRKKIWQPITKEKTSPVITALGKIRRSHDWEIDYDDHPDYYTAAAKIRTGELPMDYLEFNFPNGYTSFTNWMFQVGLRSNLIDANAVVLWMPINRDEMAQDVTTYAKPFPIVYFSDMIISHVPGDHCILKSYDKYKTTDTNGNVQYVEMWMLVTDMDVQYYRKDSRGEVVAIPELTYVHGLGYLPVVRFRGLHRENKGLYELLESRIYPIVPRLNEMAREYSDQQANITLHLFPQRWEFQSETCKNCLTNGVSTGKIRDPANDKKFIKCPACNGTTYNTNVGVYQKYVVRPAKTNMGEQPAPMPPFGYDNSLDTDVIKLVDERIEKHGYYALCAINMQFLDKTPVSQSGVAKEVDRDELNVFINSVAEDVVAFMDDSHKVIIDYRYKASIEDEKLRYALIPSVRVPQDFTILGTKFLADSVKNAREAKMSPLICAELEMEYINKAFYNDRDVAELYELINDLDPMPGMSVDEKMSVYQNGGTTKELYVISCNITPFVKRAVDEFNGTIEQYCQLPMEQKMQPLYGYAAEILKPVETIPVQP